jgi:hypothetical protein
MAVRVQFPDGSTREVPSYTVEVPSREIPPGPSSLRSRFPIRIGITRPPSATGSLNQNDRNFRY